jgi:hypothetical protein
VRHRRRTILSYERMAINKNVCDAPPEGVVLAIEQSEK